MSVQKLSVVTAVMGTGADVIRLLPVTMAMPCCFAYRSVDNEQRNVRKDVIRLKGEQSTQPPALCDALLLFIKNQYFKRQ